MRPPLLNVVLPTLLSPLVNKLKKQFYRLTYSPPQIPCSPLFEFLFDVMQDKRKRTKDEFGSVAVNLNRTVSMAGGVSKMVECPNTLIDHRCFLWSHDRT